MVKEVLFIKWDRDQIDKVLKLKKELEELRWH